MRRSQTISGPDQAPLRVSTGARGISSWGRRWAALSGLVLLLGALLGCGPLQPHPETRFTFSFPLQADDARQPRGGTTRGPEPTLAPVPHPGFVALQEEGLSDFERDRRAILAMAGPYRVSFDFLEVYALDPDYTQLDVPYQSWATEYVHVLEDRGDFISLQHVIVLFFESDGATRGPAVTKHWRQDWRYEDADLHVYRGHGRFERERVPPEHARGAWTQAVFQVDDAPRYEALGRWQHEANLSYWESETTWRPLPRREFSVRDDYHALVGRNRHVITPAGWIHEQDNSKRVVPRRGSSDPPRFVSREIGLNRYERIDGHDFSAGDLYFEATAGYWQAVREAWAEILETRDAFELLGAVEGKKRFVAHFEAARAYAEASESETAAANEPGGEKAASSTGLDPRETVARDVRTLLDRYVVSLESSTME